MKTQKPTRRIKHGTLKFWALQLGMTEKRFNDDIAHNRGGTLFGRYGSFQEKTGIPLGKWAAMTAEEKKRALEEAQTAMDRRRTKRRRKED